MKFQHVRIESMAHVLPDRVVTSEELENELRPIYERLTMQPGRLEFMTGVKERRFWQQGTPPSQVSALAGARAIEASGINRDDIGCVIHTSVCRDFLEPATAAVVHDRLGLSPSAMIFDITNACLGFLNGLITVSNMVELGQIKAGLVVAGECAENLIRTTVDQIINELEPTRQRMKTLFPTLTIGSGAVAAIVTHESISRGGHRLSGGAFRNASHHYRLCQGSRDTGAAPGQHMTMETYAEMLMVEGCKLAKETWSAARDALGWTNEMVTRTICHQVGKSYRKLMFETLDLDPSLDFETLPFMGNTGSAALPLTMSVAASEGRLTAGDKVALLGIGSGLNCMFLGVDW